MYTFIYQKFSKWPWWPDSFFSLSSIWFGGIFLISSFISKLLYPDEMRLMQKGGYWSSQPMWVLYYQDILIWDKYFTSPCIPKSLSEWKCVWDVAGCTSGSRRFDAHLSMTTESHLVYMTWESLFKCVHHHIGWLPHLWLIKDVHLFV